MDFGKCMETQKVFRPFTSTVDLYCESYLQINSNTIQELKLQIDWFLYLMQWEEYYWITGVFLLTTNYMVEDAVGWSLA